MRVLRSQAAKQNPILAAEEEKPKRRPVRRTVAAVEEEKEVGEKLMAEEGSTNPIPDKVWFLCSAS